MIEIKMCYICDTCGKKRYLPFSTKVEEVTSDQITSFTSCITETRETMLPKNWVELPPPFGHMCDVCYEGIMAARERLAARKDYISYGVGEDEYMGEDH